MKGIDNSSRALVNQNKWGTLKSNRTETRK